MDECNNLMKVGRGTIECWMLEFFSFNRDIEGSQVHSSKPQAEVREKRGETKQGRATGSMTVVYVAAA